MTDTNKNKEIQKEGPKGICCQTGCEDCPYDFSTKVDPSIPSELQPDWHKEKKEVYEGEIPKSQEN